MDAEDKKALREHLNALKAEKRRLELRIAKFDGWSSRSISSGSGSKSLGYAGIESDRKQLLAVKKMIAEAELSGSAPGGEITPLYAEFSR